MDRHRIGTHGHNIIPYRRPVVHVIFELVYYTGTHLKCLDGGRFRHRNRGPTNPSTIRCWSVFDPLPIRYQSVTNRQCWTNPSPIRCQSIPIQCQSGANPSRYDVDHATTHPNWMPIHCQHDANHMPNLSPILCQFN